MTTTTIREARRKAGLSQAALALLCGVERKTINRAERDDVRAGPLYVAAMAVCASNAGTGRALPGMGKRRVTAAPRPAVVAR